MIKIALLVAVALIAALLYSGRAYARRLDTGRTKAQRMDAAAIAAYRANAVRISILPPARTMVEIAADGAPAGKTLEDWLAESETAILRTEINALLADLATMELRILASAELSADAFARFMGYAGGVTEIRAAELIEQAHGNRTELVEKINEAVLIDMEAELAAEPDLSDEALAAVIAEWAGVPA